MAIIVKQLGKLDVHSIQTNLVFDLCAENYVIVDCQEGNPFTQSSSEQASYVANF